MKIISFYQVIGWAESFLRDMRKRGMAGNIVRDRNEQLVGGELASWTGETHQLIFMGSPEDYCLVLREVSGGEFKTIYKQQDSTKFNNVMIDFFSREG